MKNRSTHTHIYWTYSTSQSTRRKTNKDVPTCIRVVRNKLRMRYLHESNFFSFQIPQRPKRIMVLHRNVTVRSCSSKNITNIRRQLKLAFKPVLRIRIRIRIHVFLGLPGSGSGSTSQSYGSGSGSFSHHAKIVRKTLIPTI
jgi:hypothetical protein